MTGWIKLYRQLLQKPIWRQSSPEQKTILITLLLMANHDSNEWEWMGEKFTVESGQFITSLESIKDSAGKGITIQNIRSALVKFEKLQFLTNKSTKTGRLISIVNWGDYQSKEEETNKEDNKEVTKDSQRGNKEVTPNKNDKNVKNEKNEKKIIKNNIVIDESIIENYTDDLELQDTIKKFIENRKNIVKKPLTDDSLKLALKKLDKLADTNEVKIEILNESIIGGWQGIFALKNQGNKTQQEPRKVSNGDSGNVFLDLLKRRNEQNDNG